MHQPGRVADEEIISQCKTGSLKHQQLLYKRFYGYAMGISLRYSLTRDDALEVVNDAFIKVFKAIGTYNEDKPFGAWMRTIVVNTAIDRRRKELKFHSNTDIENSGLSFGSVNSSESLNVQDILNMMKQLPPLQRTIFNLHEIDGYSHDEIAVLLNVPVSSSRVYLSRAKEKLRTLLRSEAQNHGRTIG